jgi:hypothetical protein
VTEITEIGIQPIHVPQVSVYKINAPKITPAGVPVHVPIGFPVIQMPCVETRRATYENSALVNNDPDGNVVICDGSMPSFTPMDYTPEDLVPIDNNVAKQEPEEKDNFFVDCPGSKDQRIGDFRNEKRLERVKGHERSEDGKECITLYEPVAFVETYLPSGATASFTAATALVAATTPLLIPVIKSAVKTIVKKITAKKKKEK